jgi:hypothetical protein
MIHHLTQTGLPSTQKDFLLRNLRPYFWQIPLELPEAQSTLEMNEEDLMRWLKIHPSYLSAYESMALGITLFEKERPRDEFGFKIQYLQQANELANDQLKPWAIQAIGIAYFEQALKGPLDEQYTFLRLSLASFQEAQELELTSLNPRLYQVLVLVAQDKFEQALKKLYQIQHLTWLQKRPEVSLPLYEILAKIYASLGQEKVSRFYLSKLRNRRVPLRSEREISLSVLAAA